MLVDGERIERRIAVGANVLADQAEVRARVERVGRLEPLDLRVEEALAVLDVEEAVFGVGDELEMVGRPDRRVEGDLRPVARARVREVDLFADPAVEVEPVDDAAGVRLGLLEGPRGLDRAVPRLDLPR